ncbi:ribosomal protein S10p/S20e [Colletotrichum graminicola]|nr:ribosomal protein S10p/S20e [Colletotrichum graminicola]
MPELCDGHLDELLKEAASRLATKQSSRPKDCSLIAVAALPVDPTTESKAQPKAQDPRSISLRDPRPAEEKSHGDAGPGWFGIPKTDPNDPDLKRDLQILHMRGTAIDPKRHYKKESLKARIPRYAHVGRIIEGPTEFHSARLTRKERKQTLVDELLSAEKASGKFRSKYEDIQVITQRQPWIRCLATETKLATLDRHGAVGHVLAKSKEGGPRYPRSVQALYLQPLRREAEYGIPSCDLQLRSYSLRNLEFFADFALRAAYYLKLPAFGPVPLPRITERWTVPRSSFIFKKSQENFERITLRRLVQIRDGNPETVQLWLAFLQKHAYYGIGMKANVWDFDKLGVGKTMDTTDEGTAKAIETKWGHLGQNRDLNTVEKVEEFLAKVRFDVDSGKLAEGERRFVERQWKQEEALKRKAATTVETASS